MSEIGVRELKIHASEIIHKVKEKGARYVVTHRGHPIAAIIPLEEARPGSESDESAWEELDELGKQISQGWQSSQTSTEILSEIRR